MEHRDSVLCLCWTNWFGLAFVSKQHLMLQFWAFLWLIYVTASLMSMEGWFIFSPILIWHWLFCHASWLGYEKCVHWGRSLSHQFRLLPLFGSYNGRGSAGREKVTDLFPWGEALMITYDFLYVWEGKKSNILPPFRLVLDRL